MVKGQTALSWLASQRFRFLPILIAALAVVLIGYGYDWWSQNRLENAWKAYSDATKLPEPQKWEDLKTVHEKWKGLRPAFFAAVALGDHYFSEAKKAALKDEASKDVQTGALSAADWYGRALAGNDLLPAEKQLLYINRGEAQEMQKKYDEAMNDYKMASDFGGDSKPLAMLHMARALELKNDPTKAAETYERITVDFSNTEYAKMAKNHLRRLKSPLFNAKS